MGTLLQRADRGAALGVTALLAVSAVTLSIAAALTVVAPGPLTLEVPLANLQAPALGEGVPGIDGAAYSAAEITLSDVTSQERWLLGSASALGFLAAAIAIGTAAWLGWRIFRRSPFTRRLPSLVALSGIAIIASGTIGSLLQAFGVHAVLDRIDLLPPRQDGSFFLMQLDLAPLAVGLCAALVAGAFEAAYRLKRDTDGLV